MSQLKILFLVLLCFIFFSANTLFGFEKSNVRTALVNSIEAIVYSDPSLNNPIGKVSRSTHISIGKPLVKNPKVVPVIVSGRVAYMKLADLFLDEENQIIINGKENKSGFHDPDAMFQKPPENILENNTVYASLHQYSAGSQLQQLFQNIDGVNQSTMTGLSATYMHHQSMTPYLWGLGLEYYFASSPNVDFSFLLINPTFGATPVKRPLFNLDLLFSLDFSLSQSYSIKNNTHSENLSFIYGPHLGARIVAFPQSKYHLTGTLSYRYYSLVGTESYFDANEVSYSPIKRISGFNLAIGFAVDL